jgi:hypothetical protein
MLGFCNTAILYKKYIIAYRAKERIDWASEKFLAIVSHTHRICVHEYAGLFRSMIVSGPHKNLLWLPELCCWGIECPLPRCGILFPTAITITYCACSCCRNFTPDPHPCLGWPECDGDIKPGTLNTYHLAHQIQFFKWWCDWHWRDLTEYLLCDPSHFKRDM